MNEIQMGIHGVIVSRGRSIRGFSCRKSLPTQVGSLYTFSFFLLLQPRAPRPNRPEPRRSTEGGTGVWGMSMAAATARYDVIKAMQVSVGRQVGIVINVNRVRIEVGYIGQRQYPEKWRR